MVNEDGEDTGVVVVVDVTRCKFTSAVNCLVALATALLGRLEGTYL